ILPSVGRWFFSELLAGVQEELLHSSYDLTLFCVAEHSAARRQVIEEFLPRRRFDGILCVGMRPDSPEMDQLRLLDRPIISVGPHSSQMSALAIDDAAAARIVTEHLIDLGHSEIVFLGGASRADAFTLGDARRLAGYRAAM